MPEITLIVENEVGLHARPASVFVRTASGFSSDITVSHGEKSVNAKSILSVLTLGAHKGAVVVVNAKGEDAGEALSALKDLVDNNFGE
jgi:phosphocarrier protein HPr